MILLWIVKNHILHHQLKEQDCELQTVNQDSERRLESLLTVSISMGQPGHAVCRSKIELCRSRLDICGSGVGLCRSKEHLHPKKVVDS